MKDLKEYLLKVGIILFPFSLSMPLPLKYSSIALIILLATLFFHMDYKKFSLKNYWIKISFLFFFIDAIVPILFFDFYNIILKDTKLSYLLIPLLFFNSKNVLKKHFRLFIHSFCYGVLFYVFYAWVYAIYFYNFLHPNWYDFSLTDGYLFYIFYNYLPGALHHTYIGLYIIIAINLLLIYPINFKIKYINLILIIILAFTTFYVGSKIIIVLLFLNFGIYFLYKKVFNAKLVLFISTILITGFFFVKDWAFYNLSHSIEGRLTYYKCSFTLIKAKIFRGYGFKKIKGLVEYCPDINGPYLIPHNSILYSLLANGIFGLMLLFVVYCFLINKALKNKNYIFIIIVLNILTVSLIEDIFYLQRGVFFISTFVSLFLYTKLEQTINK